VPIAYRPLPSPISSVHLGGEPGGFLLRAHGGFERPARGGAPLLLVPQRRAPRLRRRRPPLALGPRPRQAGLGFGQLHRRVVAHAAQARRLLGRRLLHLAQLLGLGGQLGVQPLVLRRQRLVLPLEFVARQLQGHLRRLQVKQLPLQGSQLGGSVVGGSVPLAELRRRPLAFALATL